jgi:hypothetical protein
VERDDIREVSRSVNFPERLKSQLSERVGRKRSSRFRQGTAEAMVDGIVTSPQKPPNPPAKYYVKERSLDAAPLARVRADAEPLWQKAHSHSEEDRSSSRSTERRGVSIDGASHLGASHLGASLLSAAAATCDLLSRNRGPTVRSISISGSETRIDGSAFMKQPPWVIALGDPPPLPLPCMSSISLPTRWLYFIFTMSPDGPVKY